MAGNTFGQLFRVTTFGESHGAAIGLIIDGCPAGLVLNVEFIQQELNRRKPGQSTLTSSRAEEDKFEVLSGVFEGKTLGSPIAMIIRNSDVRSQDYNSVKDVYRPSHADFTTESKYGTRDYRGGGRASARETVARVAAGAVAKLLLAEVGISIQAFVTQIGDVRCSRSYNELDLALAESSIVRCPDQLVAEKMIKCIEETRESGDSVGGVISCVIKHCPPGLGEPVFDKLHADLAKAMMSINAARAFEIGEGFGASSMKGSEHNDSFILHDRKIATHTNHSGGIQGGISNGMDIFFRVAFKPVASIPRSQQTVNRVGAETTVYVQGRHDPCVVPRAVPIVEAMSALVLADHFLRHRSSRL